MTYFKASTKFRTTDNLFRKVILKNRPNKCEWCKQIKPVDVAHILPKGSWVKMRYQECNCLLLCRYCHNKWHDDPLAARKFLSEYKGSDYENNLHLKNALLSHKPDLKLMAVYFNQELRKEP